MLHEIDKIKTLGTKRNSLNIRIFRGARIDERFSGAKFKTCINEHVI